MDFKINKQQCISLIASVVIFDISLVVFGIDITVIIIATLVTITFAIHTIIKLSSIFKPYSKTTAINHKDYQPLVSIHLTCKNEPAELVNKTINALSKLDYPNFEVIVMNNNNNDRKNWIKIKKYVDTLGNNFTFIHLDEIKGFKAGALNYLNANHFNDKAEVNAIVDSDYLVTPDFLKETIGYFKNPKIGIVQAPQSYYNINDHNIGLSYEYRSFFALVMNQAQRLNLVTFTGTMGLIRTSLIKEGLTWNEWCITEDVEAGVHINTIGYQGVYVDKSLGKGLMPYDYTSLAKQRQRWTYGNMQIIKKDFLSVAANRALLLKQKFAFLGLLVTWFHFELILAVVYTFTSMVSLIVGDHYLIDFASSLMLALILISLVSNFFYFIVGLRKEASIPNRIRAFLVHYGLLYVMSTSWLTCLFGKKLGFIVTEKVKPGQRIPLSQHSREFSIIAILAVGLLISFFAKNATMFDLMAVMLFSIIELFGILYLYRLFVESNK